MVEFLKSLWIGFCHLVLVLFLLAAVLALAAVFFGVMFIIFWGSLWLLGKTWSLILWGIVTVLIASYGMSKEMRSLKYK